MQAASHPLVLILILLPSLVGGPLCMALAISMVQVSLGARPWWTGWGSAVRSVMTRPVVALWPQSRPPPRYQVLESMEGLDPP